MLNFRRIREYLLNSNELDAYSDIQDFLLNPMNDLKNSTLCLLKVIGESNFQNTIYEWYKNDGENYRERIILGQAIVWQEVYNAYKELIRVETLIRDLNIIYYSDNYMKSTEQISKVLKMYADAKVAITKLESNLGVDRYLDNLSEKDFAILIQKFDEIHRITELKLAEYKLLYIRKWNTTNVYDAIIHKSIRRNMTNQVCTLLESRKKRIFLFLIDGFGMGQYFWSKKVVPQNSNLTYSNNIFDWLCKEGVSEELVLGAPLITDTAAGISQIFIGKTSKDTRVISSTLKKSGDHRVIPVKSLRKSEFRKIINTEFNSFTNEILTEKECMKIYYCSRYDYENISGFSNYVFSDAEVESIIPAERVFSFLKDDFSVNKDGVTVVYITNIDNSGHSMGSFSQFERYEHEKINLLLKNFFIEIAKCNPEFFDGTASILLTADHGMTESYRINISRFEILDTLKELNEHPRVIEANRAEFLYDITPSKVEKCKEALYKFFNSKKIDTLILTCNDALYNEVMPNYEELYEDTIPSIIILLISEGIFYSKTVGENLMHFGGHGGHSVDEVFVPLVNIELNAKFLDKIKTRFLNLD